MMLNGRPATGSYITFFYPKDSKEYVNSLTEKSDVSHWQCFSGQIDSNFNLNGQGRLWLSNARTFIGEFENF